MNMHHLHVFHAVAQSGRISEAAKQLHIAQPAVSRHIRELEERLDVVLFDRLPRGVRLTQAGRLLAQHARRVFAIADQAEQAMRDLKNVTRGRLAIGASTTIGNYLLPPVLARFRQSYPGVDIALEISNTDIIQQNLLDANIDLGLTEGFVNSPDLEASVFHMDELILIGPPVAGYADASLSAAELSRLPCIVREPGSGTRAVVESALAERGLTLRTSMSLGGSEAIKRAVAAGAGYALMSRLAVEKELANAELQEIIVRDLSLQRPLHLIRQRKRQPARAVEAFLAEFAPSTQGIEKPPLLNGS